MQKKVYISLRYCQDKLPLYDIIRHEHLRTELPCMADMRLFHEILYREHSLPYGMWRMAPANFAVNRIVCAVGSCWGSYSCDGVKPF